MTIIMPATSPKTPPTIGLRVIGDRAVAIRAVDALRQVLDVEHVSTPRKNRRDNPREPGVRVYVEASGVRDVVITPGSPALQPSTTPAEPAELAGDLRAMDWYPLQPGDVVTVDYGTLGGHTFAVAAPPLSANWFTCPRCGRTSHLSDDLIWGYCGACHDWTADQAPLTLISCAGLPDDAPPGPPPRSRVTFAELWFDEQGAKITVIRGGQTVFARPPLPVGAHRGEHR